MLGMKAKREDESSEPCSQKKKKANKTHARTALSGTKSIFILHANGAPFLGVGSTHVFKSQTAKSDLACRRDSAVSPNVCKVWWKK